MSLPEDVVQKLNSRLGFEGRPHLILIDGQVVDTGCIEWSPKLNSVTLMANMSPDLKTAFTHLSEVTAKEAGNPQEMLDAYFANQPTAIHDEYIQLRDHLESISHYGTALDIPDLSSEAQAVSKRVFDRLSAENFMRGKVFRMKAYEARMVEIREEELEHNPTVREEFDRYARKFEAAREGNLRAEKLSEVHLRGVRELLVDDPVMAYRPGIEWQGVPSVSYETIVVAPTQNPYDILRFEQTQAGNYGMDTGDIITKLKELDTTFGINIIGAGCDGLEFELKRIPKGPEAKELGQWLLAFCPDLFEAPTRFRKGKVALWWD